MKSEQCTSLRDTVEDSLQTSFWDTNQFAQSSGTNTPVKSSENEQQMDGSQICQCGKGTLDCSIHPHTKAKWISYMQDSLAKILALQENRQGLAMKHAVASTVKSSASLAYFDQDSCSWRTCQQSLITDSEQSWQTLPRSGMTRNGFAYALPTVGRITTETGGGYLPTPDTRGFVNEGSIQMLSKKCDSKEEMFGMAHRAGKKKKEKYWPTPTAHNAKETNAPSESERNTPTLAAMVGGKLNPEWVEWLMGFPIGHTASRDWGMVNVRSKQQQPTACSEVSE